MRFRLFFAASLAVFFAAPAFSDGLHLRNLSCEHEATPRGVETPSPRLSWALESKTRGQRQSAYQILVARSREDLDANRADLWDSKKIVSNQTLAVRYAGKALASGQKCWWKVRVFDKNGTVSKDSTPSVWQMGIVKKSDWKAQWISARTPLPKPRKDGLILPQSAYLRREFDVRKPIKSAALFVTAHGVYEARLNGARVGNAVLAPGWTDYRRRIQYQTYDVTARIHPGPNALGAILGDGWYAGYVGFSHQRDHYGTTPQFLAQLQIEYADGSRQTLVSDKNWTASNGPIRYSDLLMGEKYDARAENVHWDKPNFDASNWRPVQIGTDKPKKTFTEVTKLLQNKLENNALTITATNAALGGDPAYGSVKTLRVEYRTGSQAKTKTVAEGETLTLPAPGDHIGRLIIERAVYGATPIISGPTQLVGSSAPPVRVTQTLTPKRVTEPTPKVYLFDMGQNMVGWARLTVKARAGTQITLRFGEMLNPNGTLYTANLRGARAEDTYICRSDKTETWEPRFTFHGFRYVEVRGFLRRPEKTAIAGRVVGSDITPTGTFVCSSPLVNQLQHNILWGQRGNFLSVPTDCPQRDERLGWMGDAQIFARTATFNFDVASFYEKWMQDVDDAQSAEGGFSDVSPRLVDGSDAAPAWGDAGIIVPWTTYQAYGDPEILRRHWPAMTRWLTYITSVNPGGLWLNRRNNDFGDWLSLNADTPKDLLATAYYAYDASLMARIARALDKPKDAAKYDALFAHIKTAFNTAYVSPDGKIKGETQTGYLLALRFNLLPENLRPLAARHLTDDIAAKKMHLSTGFVGVGYLCPVLTQTGRTDVAYKLLLTDTYPSWGYSIRQGATTIWERWDGWTRDRGFQTPAMNSFNHYSLGSVGQWLYQDVAGIDTDPARPGYAHLILRPHPAAGLSFVRAALRAPCGTIASRWTTKSGRFFWSVTIPANTSATVFLPTASPAAVTESGQNIASVSGPRFVRAEPGVAVYEVPSGTYRFESPLP